MTAQIKVKVQRKAIVKLKGIVKFPADVVAEPGIIITRSGRTYTFSLDPASGAFVTLDGVQTLTHKTLTAPDINGGTADSLTSLSVRDTSAAFDLLIAAVSSVALTANRTLTIDVANASRAVNIYGALSFGGNFQYVNSHGLALRTTAATDITLPTTGTLATLAGAEALTNKSINGMTIGATTGTFNLGSGKTITFPNTIQFAGVDGTTVTFQGTDTYVGRTTVDVLTNKTYDTAGTGNSFSINGLAATANTGTGAVVRATSPTLVTPALGTPSSVTLTSATGLPVSTGISGLGTGIATFLATPSSANFAAAITDETGTGKVVLDTAPTFSSTVNAVTGYQVNGAATTAHYLRGNGTNYVDSAILAGDLPLASSSAFGAVKVDNTTITATAGVITAVGAAATSIAVGTTTVGSGTTNQLLYDNGGVLGEVTKVNSGIYQTNGSGVPLCATTVPAGTVTAKIALLFGNSIATNIANSTQYINSAGYIATTEFYSAIPFSGTLKNMYVASQVGAGGAQTFTYTVRVNTVDTALTCQSSAGGTTANDTTHTVAVTAGQVVGIKLVSSATAALTYHSISLELDATNV